MPTNSAYASSRTTIGCRSPGRGRVRGETGEQRGDRALGLRQRGRVVRAAQPDDGCVVLGGRGAHRGQVESPAGRLAEPRDRDDRRSALLGQHAVHRVGRDRDDRPAAGRDEDLGHDVEDLVRPGSDQDLGRRHAVAGGGGLDESPVVGRRILGERRHEPAGGEQTRREVRRGRRGVQVEADDRRGVEPVACGDLLIGRLPRIARWRVGRGEGDGRRAHPRRVGQASVPAVPSGRLELLAVGVHHLLGDVAGHVVVVIERRRERAAALGE